TTDLNGDGFDDVVYTTVSQNGKSDVGTDTDFFAAKHRRVALHLANNFGLAAAKDISNTFGALADNEGGARFDPFRTRPGDFDADGTSELMVFGKHGDNTYGNRVYQWHLFTSQLIRRGSLVNPPEGVGPFSSGSS